MISAHSSSNRFANFAVNFSPKTRWNVALLFPLVVGPVWCLTWHGVGGRTGTLAGLVLLAALGTSAITDIRRQRIYNWVTYTAFLWALVINIVATANSFGVEPIKPSLQPAAIVGPHALGGVGIGECLAGAAVCFLVTCFGYDLSGGGAGDVKIATVIGALLGLHDGIFAIAYSYVVAAIAIMIWSTYKNGALALLKAGGRKVSRVLGPLSPVTTTSEDKALLLKPVPLGPYFAIGTLLILWGLVPS